MRHGSRRRLLAAGLAAGVLPLLSACGGGGTSCDDFASMSADDQRSAIVNALKDTNQATNEFQIELAEGNIAGYCGSGAGKNIKDAVK